VAISAFNHIPIANWRSCEVADDDEAADEDEDGDEDGDGDVPTDFASVWRRGVFLDCSFPDLIGRLSIQTYQQAAPLGKQLLTPPKISHTFAGRILSDLLVFAA